MSLLCGGPALLPRHGNQHSSHFANLPMKFFAVMNDLLIFFLACLTPCLRAFSSVRFGARRARKVPPELTHPSP
jgi:hypothetical protein